MFDKEIVLENLQKIRQTIEIVSERAAVVDDPNELLLCWFVHSWQRRKVPPHWLLQQAR